MSKRITRNTSYLSLLENSLNELFSPSSKKAILNFNELKLLNLDELKLINTDDLKLLDMKQLRLFDFALLSIFFQYIGALSLTLMMGFVVGLGTYAVHDTLNTTVFAKDSNATQVFAEVRKQNMNKPRSNAEANIAADAVAFSDVKRDSASSVSTFEVLIANNEGGSTSPVEVRVLGTSDVLTEAVDTEEVQAAKPIQSCSFSVVEGKETSKYSNGSRLVSSKGTRICAETNTGSKSYSWNLEGRVYETTDNCISSAAINSASNLNVVLTDSNDRSVASCSLTLVRENVIAGIN